MTVLQDRHGPDWPLGFINVAVPGTPVGIMSLVDPGNINDPASTSGDEYTVRGNQVILQGMKPAAHGMQNNTGNVYLVRKGGSRDDTGTIIATIGPGQTFILSPTAMAKNAFSPYRYYIDSDNAGDGVSATLLIF